jgi:hypothetical protein
MVVVIGDPFSVQVAEVRSLSRSERAGFGKAPALYHVSASGPTANYSVYCVKAAPVAGTTYMARINYLDGVLSFLRLWPEEKKNLSLPPGQSTKRQGLIE